MVEIVTPESQKWPRFVQLRAQYCSRYNNRPVWSIDQLAYLIGKSVEVAALIGDTGYVVFRSAVEGNENTIWLDEVYVPDQETLKDLIVHMGKTPVRYKMFAWSKEEGDLFIHHAQARPKAVLLEMYAPVWKEYVQSTKEQVQSEENTHVEQETKDVDEDVPERRHVLYRCRYCNDVIVGKREFLFHVKQHRAERQEEEQEAYEE
jgi:hypothetical protein